MIGRVALVALTLSVSGAVVRAQSSDIAVVAPWLRATPKNASVAGGYLTITNKSASADILLGASLPMAPDGQVHSMSMAGGIMRMERLTKGLPIPAGATVKLTPGGYHLMFVKPKTQLNEGDTIAGSLTFAKAGKVAVTFPVAGFGAKESPTTK